MLALPGVTFPEAVLAEGAAHQPFAVWAEGGPGSALVWFEGVKSLDQLTCVSVPDLGALALPIPAGQPSAVRAKGDVSQTWTLDQQLASRVLPLIKESLAEFRAV